MTKVLILGSQGLLGIEFFKYLSKLGHLQLIPFSRFNLDLENLDAIIPAITKLKPEIIINAAGYTDTEKAELAENQEQVDLVNTLAPEQIALAAKKINAQHVYFSTDFVFAGDQEEGYLESTKKNPLNYYGLSKSRGEDLALKAYPESKIVRISWLFGAEGKNFVSTITSLLKKEQQIKAVNDTQVKLTYAPDLAQTVSDLLLEFSWPGGIYHLPNEGVYNLFEVAELIKANLKLDKEIIPVGQDHFSSNIKRPKNALLVNSKLPKSRPFKAALADFLEQS